MIIDTHFHPQLINDFKTRKASACQGVSQALAVCIQPQDGNYLVNISKLFPDIFFSIGIHPLALHDRTIDETLFDHNRCLAIGETGLDFLKTRDEKTQRKQIDNFIQHLLWSQYYSKPVIVHSRAAEKDTLKLLSQYRTLGVLHSFTGSLTMAETAIKLGYSISFSGILTFKNAAELRHVASCIDIKHILLETDAPFLAPEPVRGSINAPKNIIHTATLLAAIKGLSLNEIIAHTTSNARRLFNFPATH
jgi:TatD DNase family protein